MIKFEVMWRTRAHDDEFSIFSLTVHTVLINFILGLRIHTFQAERHGVSVHDVVPVWPRSRNIVGPGHARLVHLLRARGLGLLFKRVIHFMLKKVIVF